MYYNYVALTKVKLKKLSVNRSRLLSNFTNRIHLEYVCSTYPLEIFMEF